MSGRHQRGSDQRGSDPTTESHSVPTADDAADEVEWTLLCAAAASVGIEHGMTTEEVLAAITCRHGNRGDCAYCRECEGGK